ncbi:Uncharacterized conserved protein YgbK, DUF1537 family [Tistlia consotensis]|uniref:Uncharacterized conserved protein YgbK, DUF1537 family n=1 Tax=Tistlia consotensis USBA 355 TaxID=560819 RepID=A0A1Y6BJ04_9PROT|nr:four-carbon acid sugar kinase family protein [Tistlia consotensis]SMF13838.1 Uncharacterized conserved protein YgbK, DUF1537 family [Tistlia consotensis USBA 355]SNR50148.1 Uncharacterized conserved protein YgbK, DUF1537 family [Tistlia consotensis]
MPGLRPYLFCADDFTGASDTLGTLARGGLAVRLYLDAAEALRDSAHLTLDAIGIATATRSLPPEAIQAELAHLADALARMQPRLLHYKVCSTFDSSPTVGSIGAAARSLGERLGLTRLAVVGGQPSLGRYCHYGNLFARAADGAVYRIDRHPVMGRHPVTPMAEADLRLHLAAQGLPQPQLVERGLYRAGAAALAERLEALWGDGRQPVLFDVGEQDDLAAVGGALAAVAERAPLLCVGPSSVAEALLAAGALRASRPASGGGAAVVARDGRPCFVLSGSRSAVTERQIEAAGGFARLPIEPGELVHDTRRRCGEIAARCAELLAEGRSVLAHLLPGAEHGLSNVKLAAATATIAAEVARSGLAGTLVVAGGDTSSMAVRALGLTSISFQADLDPGAPLCLAHAADPQLDGLPLVLKGGQMGREDLFRRLGQGRI